MDYSSDNLEDFVFSDDDDDGYDSLSNAGMVVKQPLITIEF